jgi:hypothetical protein
MQRYDKSLTENRPNINLAKRQFVITALRRNKKISCIHPASCVVNPRELRAVATALQAEGHRLRWSGPFLVLDRGWL